MIIKAQLLLKSGLKSSVIPAKIYPEQYKSVKTD